MAAPYPLDPLTEEETAAAAAAASEKLKAEGELRFNAISLKEPAKKAFLAWKSGSADIPEREATVIVQVPHPLPHMPN